jgi:oxygen-independent coproporphyrinogen-3 oxidase
MPEALGGRREQAQRARAAPPQPPPLSLYVHVPWCARKCPYCDFNSHEVRGAIPEARYVAALARDLERAAPQLAGRRIETVFFGGGTPSLFSARAIAAILEAVRAQLALAPDAEVTLEANPGTVEAERFRAFRQAGVNRLSLGVQSFDSRRLAALGRIHDGEQARRAVEAALRAFENVNLDLMYGLPEQRLEEALADVETALALGPPHLSCYQLTIEPNTYFHRFPPPLPDEDAIAAIEEALEERLAAAGYERYEVSAYARGARCRHNLNYWTFGDYLGLGAGAHGKLTLSGTIVREARVKHPARYMEAAERGSAVAERRELEPQELPLEFAMNALRLAEGFPERLFEERTGLPLSACSPALEEAERRGLLERTGGHVRASALGRRFLNELLLLFVAPKARAAAEWAPEPGARAPATAAPAGFSSAGIRD